MRTADDILFLIGQSRIFPLKLPSGHLETRGCLIAICLFMLVAPDSGVGCVVRVNSLSEYTPMFKMYRSRLPGVKCPEGGHTSKGRTIVLEKDEDLHDLE